MSDRGSTSTRRHIKTTSVHFTSRSADQKRRAALTGLVVLRMAANEDRVRRNRKAPRPNRRAKRRRGRRSLKCYEIQGPNGVDGLALVDRPVPKPGAGEVLVWLTAATLNYRDLLTIKGGYGSRQKFPLVPVSDGAGVIEAIGADVREFATGDRVIGSFFQNWIGGEPSEAKMSTALGGSVDGVLTEYGVFPE